MLKVNFGDLWLKVSVSKYENSSVNSGHDTHPTLNHAEILYIQLSNFVKIELCNLLDLFCQVCLIGRMQRKIMMLKYF